MKTFFAIMLAALLTDNFVLTKFMGICPFLGVSKKASSSLGMGVAVTFVMVCAAAVTYPVYHFILVPLDITYLKTIAFILIIALFVQLVETALKKLMPPLYKALGVYLPPITTNCAVLGLTILNIDNDYSFLHSLENAFFSGAGFLLVMLIFSGVRSRVEEADVPETFKGVPATLIAAAILSLSFLGFSGIGG